MVGSEGCSRRGKVAGDFVANCTDPDDAADYSSGTEPSSDDERMPGRTERKRPPETDSDCGNGE